MAEVQIKFYNTDHIVFLEKSRAEKIIRDDFDNFLIKATIHHIDILENKNQILCTFFCDKCE